MSGYASGVYGTQSGGALQSQQQAPAGWDPRVAFQGLPPHSATNPIDSSGMGRFLQLQQDAVQRASNTYQQMKDFSQKAANGQIQAKVVVPPKQASGTAAMPIPGGQQQSTTPGSYGNMVPVPLQEFAHSLSDSFGTTPMLHQVVHPFQAYAEDQAKYAEHPLQRVWDKGILQNPGIAPAIGLYQGAKRSLGELGQAYDAAHQGNGWGVAQHAIQAVPILGPGLTRAADQAGDNGMGARGNSYLQDVGKIWSSPGAMGTLTGMSAQAALAASSVKPIANAISEPFRGFRFSSSPDLLKPNSTPEQVAAKLSDFHQLSLRKDLYAGNIIKYMKMLENGETAPPITLDDGAIYDGSHRAAAGHIMNKPPAARPLDPARAADIPRGTATPISKLPVLPGFKQ